MSISFSAPDLLPTYQAIIDGTTGYDWAIWNQTNDALKTQATGSGLDDLEEEFMDGRIQYAFARVKDKSSSLEKFVMIAWCGEGVPENKKGLFHTQMNQVSTKFLKGAHLVLQARSEMDVTPSLIHKRIQESSGSKYSSSAAAPVRQAPAPAAKPVPSFRPSQGFGGAQGKPATVPTPAPTFTRPTPAARAEPPIRQPSPPPREPSPPPPKPQVPPPQAKVITAHLPTPDEASKPVYEDRIAPVGTAYEPVKLSAPGKLAGRWNPGGAAKEEDTQPVGGSIKSRMAAFGGGNAPPSAPAPGLSSGGPKKLSWAERQAETKRQREEEEKASASASSNAGVGSFLGSGVAAAASVVATGATVAADTIASGASNAYSAVQSAVVPDESTKPTQSSSTQANRSVPPRPVDSDDEKEDEDDWGSAPAPKAPASFRPEPIVADEEDTEPIAPPPPPPPPPPPMPQIADPQVAELERLKADLKLEDVSQAGSGGPPPVPLGTRPGGTAAPILVAGKRAKAMYEYEAAEDNEISLQEGEVITQIEEIDEGWWSGTNSLGKSGLFPSNYCEMIEEEDAESQDAIPPPPPPPPPPPAPAMPPAAAAANRQIEEQEEGEVMIAAYDYEAAEDNEISFKEGERITGIEKVDTDWWQGKAGGKEGLFPAAYVITQDEFQAQ